MFRGESKKKESIGRCRSGNATELKIKIYLNCDSPRFGISSAYPAQQRKPISKSGEILRFQNTLSPLLRMDEKGSTRRTPPMIWKSRLV